MDWSRFFAETWYFLLPAVSLAIALVAASHALLYKRDTRGATLWAAIILFTPLIGACLYAIFGINRIKRRATQERGGAAQALKAPSCPTCDARELAAILGEPNRHLAEMSRTITRFVDRPLLPGNQVTPLVNGDEAYPAMLEAIGQARSSITLASYIFDRDVAGRAFVEALAAARQRGVEIRVLVDATGARYSWPSILHLLEKAAIPHARFFATSALWQLLTLNMRSHRKILVVDGCLGFTGGMNIREGHWLAKRPRTPVRDLHFRVEGPVVGQLQEAFANDWLHTTRETLTGDTWFPPLESRGPVCCRGISDGPDEDFEKLRWTIIAALGAARRTARIATPYFLPEPTVIAALNLAAMRGVQVDILLPEQSNLPFVQWASVAHWWQVLQRGCRIWLNPSPFLHAKVFVVDECWALVGSTNWDPRSLRLNFEFDLESYDQALGRKLADWFDAERGRSRQTSLEEENARPLPLRLRNAVARLLTPYL